MSAESILLADEDASSLEVERFYLEREGYRIFSVKTGFDALNSAQTIRPNLIILAMTLPGLNGFEVCNRLRRENNQVPILAVFENEDELRGSVNVGLEADDYLSKPFMPREMVARVRMLLHPSKPRTKRGATTLAVGPLKLDTSSGTFSINEKIIPLRRLDQELLACLMRDTGKFISLDRLVNESWGEDDLRQTTGLDIHIARLQGLLAGGGIKIIVDSQAGIKLVA